MANISTYLGKILTAIYGEEVRGAIHNALAAMNTESSQAMEYAAGARDSAQSYANDAKGYRDTASTYVSTTKGYMDSAETHATTARNQVAAIQNTLNAASGYADEARGYMDQAIAAKAEATNQANKSAQSALESGGNMDSSKLYRDEVLAAELRIAEIVRTLQQYIYTMESFNEFTNDYELTSPIQDSNGDAILDSNGEPIVSYVNGFKAFTESVVELQAVVARHTAEIRELQGA